MGARIILCDPHRVVVTGPSRALRPAAGEPRHPRRHGDADRGLCAEGTSAIGNISEIDRGYERIDERLRALGARSSASDVADRRMPAYAQRRWRESAAGVRVELRGTRARRHVATGLPVLDHLSASSPRCGGFELSLEVAPGSADEEVAAAGRALGDALARAAARRRRGRPRLGARCRPTRRSPASCSRSRTSRSSRLERRLLGPARRRARDRRRRALPRASSPRGGRARTSTSGCSRARTRARARGDLQGARRRARPGVRPTATEESRDARRSSAPRRRRRRSRARRTRRRSGRTASSSSRASSRSSPARRSSCPAAIAEQTEQVFANLRAILEAAGSVARPAREDDRLPPEPRRLRRR